MAGKNVEGCPAVTGRTHHFPHVTRFSARKDFREFRDKSAGDGTATNDDGKRPPEAGVLGVLLSKE
jgi:hypothetical protein